MLLVVNPIECVNDVFMSMIGNSDDRDYQQVQSRKKTLQKLKFKIIGLGRKKVTLLLRARRAIKKNCAHIFWHSERIFRDEIKVH